MGGVHLGSLELIDTEALYSIGSQDKELRLLQVRLPLAIDQGRKDKQLSVTALGGELVTTQGRCAVISEVGYRVNKAYLKPQDYNACLVVENFEAFVFIHQFNLPALGHVLVLYRGHDMTARADHSINLIRMSPLKCGNYPSFCRKIDYTHQN